MAVLVFFRKVTLTLLMSLLLLSTLDANTHAKWVLIFSNGLIIIVPLNNNSTGLKKTGQTISYDVNGKEVTNNSIKDDGYYEKGVRPNYTRNNGIDIVTDHITGLEWQDNTESKTVYMNWVDAQNYCANLTLGSHNDWRLPKIEELMYIVDRSRSKPAIDETYFRNVVTHSYWSSLSKVGFEHNAWVVNFFFGRDYMQNKSTNSRIRCVRDGS